MFTPRSFAGLTEVICPAKKNGSLALLMLKKVISKEHTVSFVMDALRSRQFCIRTLRAFTTEDIRSRLDSHERP